jgi:hypothetical protein
MPLFNYMLDRQYITRMPANITASFAEPRDDCREFRLIDGHIIPPLHYRYAPYTITLSSSTIPNTPHTIDERLSFANSRQHCHHQAGFSYIFYIAHHIMLYV